MSIFYRNQTFDLTTTNLTTVLTIAVSAIAIVKTVQAVHTIAADVQTNLFIKKPGVGDVTIATENINKATVDMITNTLNLEAGDVIKLQADTANKITGVISYALINRENENG